MWKLPTGITLALVSGSALAHGEEILLIPIYQLGAICTVVLACRPLFRRARWWVLGVFVAIATWAVTGDSVWTGRHAPKFAETSNWGFFIYGSLVPLAAFGVIVAIAWRLQKLHEFRAFDER